MTFTFVQWNDLHLRPIGRKASYPNLVQSPHRAQWLLDELAHLEVPTKPSFVMSVGDLIDGGVDDLSEDFRSLQADLIDQAACPILPCAGNHERMHQGHRLDDGSAYDDFYGQGLRQYCFQKDGVAFIVLDTSGAPVEDETAAKQRVAYLESTLQITAGLPTIIVSHVPFYPIRQPEVLARSFGMSHWVMPRGPLHEVVEAASDQVVMVLGGHVHLTGMVEHNGIRQFVMGGVAGCPIDYAIHEVSEDSISTRVVNGPAMLEDVNGVHGRPRHTMDYTDASHPTHDLYLRGLAHERDFVTPLKREQKAEKEVVNSLPVFEDVLLQLP